MVFPKIKVGTTQPIAPAIMAGKKTLTKTSEILVSPFSAGFISEAFFTCFKPKEKMINPKNIPIPAVMNASPQPNLFLINAAIILQTKAPILIPI